MQVVLRLLFSRFYIFFMLPTFFLILRRQSSIQMFKFQREALLLKTMSRKRKKHPITYQENISMHAHMRMTFRFRSLYHRNRWLMHWPCIILFGGSWNLKEFYWPLVDAHGLIHSWVKKTSHCAFAHNFVKCSLIFKILSPADVCGQTDPQTCWHAHHNYLLTSLYRASKNVFEYAFRSTITWWITTLCCMKHTSSTVWSRVWTQQ